MNKELARNKIFDGWQLRLQHQSDVLGCEMVYSVYLPPQAEQSNVPVLYWLSGLTCNDQNFVTKAGAQRYAAEYGVAIVAPDTSPRGDQVADDEAWDVAQGAGFYVNATEAPWSDHYRMYDYIVNELPALIHTSQPVDTGRVGIFGHSMGGHGALTIALKNPGRYRSVSAFSPICAPMQCPWGQKAFSLYLGDDRETWRPYDASELVANASERLPILIDQGGADDFLGQQLKPQRLLEACKHYDHPLNYRLREGYDHSYYFISSFIGEHIKHHAEAMS